MPRSGSTLMQNILAQNPDIYATPTDGVLELLYAARNNYTNQAEFKAQDPKQMLQAWRGFCKGGLEGYVRGLSNKPNTCIKSRGIGIHYEWFEAFMGEKPKVICMVRNLKAIISSMEKQYRLGKEQAQPIQDHANMRGTTVAKRVDIWMNSQPVGLALERFSEMELRGTDKNCLFVRFEDLTSNPKTTMSRVYEYLDLPECTHDFNNIEQKTMEDDTLYGLSSALHIIKPKIEPIKPDWIDVLGKDVCKWLDDVSIRYQTKFKYSS